ncbi:MAG: ribonuclease E activity regulator RraA [Gammaproteobacteria bacterium]|nr:ribonuclease E activity regulator RraA [Gammaproteobacteria bacterium]
MQIHTADLCDANESSVSVAEPLFRDFGGLVSFYGKISTVKCFEDNSLVREALKGPGAGHVLVVDGGGSTRRALVGDILAQSGADNHWAGIVVYGCIRDSGIIATIKIGCKAVATVPLKTEKKGAGEKDVPVHFANVDFIPGQFLYADEDGIIVSKKNLLTQT